MFACIVVECITLHKACIDDAVCNQRLIQFREHEFVCWIVYCTRTRRILFMQHAHAQAPSDRHKEHFKGGTERACACSCVCMCESACEFASMSESWSVCTLAYVIGGVIVSSYYYISVSSYYYVSTDCVRANSFAHMLLVKKYTQTLNPINIKGKLEKVL